MLSVPNYKVTACIYESSKSLVLRGFREADGLPLVLKLLKQDYPNADELSRFREEHAIIRSLRLDGVIECYGLEAYQNSLVLLLEDFGGDSLASYQRAPPKDGRAALAIPEFLWIAIRTAAALGEIHAAGVIHKDINPSNIVINPDSGQVKIIDFGIASRFSRETPVLKNPALLEGSLDYLSPEQTGRMNRTLDYRTDFYSLGVTFYELLTGQLPFTAEDPLELVHCHIALLPLPPHTLNPAVPTILSELVMMLLAKNADDRYQSAWGIQADLQVCQQQWDQGGSIHAFPLAREDVSDHFLIPHKLYGREQEVEVLLEAFEQLADATAQQDVSDPASATPGRRLFLIAGYSGIGKTALVEDLYKSITERQGYFVAGKFDQLQRNTPYSGLASALADLLRQILSEAEDRLQGWRERLLSALGVNGQLIVDLIPELQLILGPQPPVPRLEAHEARNRFNLVFLQFFQVFCTPEHPLVIFLDDLQWADSATLNWFQLILTDNRISSLLLLGSYRNNEVEPSHPLIQTLRQLRDKQVEVNELVVEPLGQTHVTQLIAETLHADEHSVAALAEVVWHKTNGNPFFINVFLKILYTEGLIRFDRHAHCWSWDQAHIEAQGITENVVELMIRRLQQLPASTVGILQLAACIGARFSLSMLSIASEQDPTCVYADICPAIEGDVVLTQSPLELDGKRLVQDYRFGHDRIQQAAYALIAEAERPAIHLKIGQLLLNNLASEQREERIFEIVYQLNFGHALLGDQPQRDQLAQLNLSAGRKAKCATAYEAAVEYLQAGIDWLAPDSWDNQYQLTLALHEAIAEATLLNGDFIQVQHWVERVLTRVRTVLDATKVYEVQIYAYTAQERLQEAIQVGITALERFGFPLPATPSEEDVHSAIAETNGLLPATGIEALINLPEMRNPYALAAMRISYVLAAPAYMASPRHFCLSALAETRMSIRYGNAPMSAASYAHYGVILCGVIHDIENGYQFGRLAFKLAKRYDDMALNAKVALVTGTFVLAWKLHPRDTLMLLRQGVDDGMGSGNLQAAAICRYSEGVAGFVIGQELAMMECKFANNGVLFHQMRQESHTALNAQLHQAILNLLGRSSDPCRLIGDAVNENELLAQFHATDNASGLYTLHLWKLMLCYLFGRYGEALDHARTAAAYEAGVTAQVFVPLWYFFDSLTRLAIADTLSAGAATDLLVPVISNQERLKHWAGFAPQNFQHKYDLVQAERCRISGEWLKAMACFDAAINGARDNGYIQEEALANELAARFYLTHARIKIARVYLHDAHYGYIKWGSVAKADELQASYPQLLNQTAPTNRQASAPEQYVLRPTSYSDSTNPVSLDVEAIMQASRALSEEIVLSKLLKKLMQIILENAGAEQGWLLLEEETEWRIQAAAKINQEVELLYSSASTRSERDEQLPQSVIHFVARSHENVVLDNASQAKQFQKDPYIIAHQPKSVLCVPLQYQGNLRAIVYLENNLTTMAFTRDRVEMVKLLCAQASISLENAQLYTEQAAYTHQLEERVAERTAELEQVNHELQQLANLDGLTQLANRRRFDECLTQEWKLLAREQQSLTLVLCDVDHFKEYNDCYGHQQGDDCLKQIAKVLRRVATRPADLVARYGGEEFVLILPGTDETGARSVSERIQQEIRQLRLTHARSEVAEFVTLSLGVASIIPSLDVAPEILIKHADTALYEAKRRGRDRSIYLSVSNS